MTPRKIVAELDRYIVGQAEAKRAVAVAIRNRWRRQQVPEEMRDEIGPKNMMMIGPTGVGKTEIARRLATLTGAPFIKVEATKYTEVGYYGRDVESMVRELVENAIGIVRTAERKEIEQKASVATEERIIDLLEKVIPEIVQKAAGVPTKTSDASSKAGNNAAKKTSAGFPKELAGLSDHLFEIPSEIAEKLEKNPEFPMPGFAEFAKNFSRSLSERAAAESAAANGLSSANASAESSAESAANDSDPLDASDLFSAESNGSQNADAAESSAPMQIDREEVRRRLAAGEYESTPVPITSEQKLPPMMIGGIGMESMENDLQNMFENILPKKNTRRELPVSEARKVIFEQEVERLIDREKVNAEAIKLAESLGIIFIDEIDKIVASERQNGADVSRQGVQRDLLPIVEGTTIQTKYGFISTDHVLFIAAGAFHRSKPSDLMPELQGRFPIRVELTDLAEEDLARILTEPHGALTKQYTALMQTEGVELVFEEDAIRALAHYAHEVNQTSQNIGARRLYTIMERLLEELSFEAPDMKMGRVVVNAAYVADRLEEVTADEDQSRFIL